MKYLDVIVRIIVWRIFFRESVFVIFVVFFVFFGLLFVDDVVGVG